MKKVILCLMLLLSVQLLSSQIRSLSPADQEKEKNEDVTMISHSVSMGETVKLISQKYLVTPMAIYKANKFAVDGVSPGMVLQIPVPNKSKIARNARKSKQPEPEVAQKEEGGVIPSNEGASASIGEEGNTHKVTSGETLSGLAQQYGVSQQELKEWNPSLKKRQLRAGELIKVSAN